MKIKKIYIKNFRSIKELSFTFPEKGFLVLVGPNNAGKSNILRGRIEFKQGLKMAD